MTFLSPISSPMAILKLPNDPLRHLLPSHTYTSATGKLKSENKLASFSFSSPLLLKYTWQKSPRPKVTTSFLFQNTATFSNKKIFFCFGSSFFPAPFFSKVPCRFPSYLMETSVNKVDKVNKVNKVNFRHPLQFSRKLIFRRSNPSMEIQNQTEETASKLVFSFPYIPTAAQETMASILATLEAEIGHDLLDSQTSDDVINLRSPNGNAVGSVRLWAGKDRSYIDRVLISSLHCELPHVTLDFATLVVLMGNGTDAPDFLLEFPFNGNSKMTMVLDLLPRKDLALHVDYLKRIYEKSTLPALYMQCEQDTRLRPYVPPSLYIRSVTSPTSLLYTVEATKDFSLDEAIREIVCPITENFVADWIHAVKHRSVTVEDDMERQKLSERDKIVRANGIEEDLTGNLPRLFGEEATSAVLEAFRKGV